MKKLELYYFPECPYCQIVQETIRETGLEKNVILKNIRQNSKDKDFLIQVTGRATVPCLFIDGKPMHESRDISLWLKNYLKELDE
jgi:glutaredoxin